MKKITFVLLSIVIVTIVLSCEKKETLNELLGKTTMLTTSQLEKLLALGVNVDNVTLENLRLFDGTLEKNLVLGDITIPVAKIDEYVTLKTSENNKQQLEASNIVAPEYRNIKIVGYSGEGFALTSKMRTALSWAVSNYNNLSTTLNFSLTYGADTDTADIIVYKVEGEAGGSAGFPSINGKPYKYVRINSDTDNLSINMNEHIITHEIGHCIGLRHKDWMNPCGKGLISDAEFKLIQDKSAFLFEDSIMQSCFSSTSDGEFTDADKNLITFLYQKK